MTNRKRHFAKLAARERAAERHAERVPTRSYLWSWRTGEILRTDDGGLYEIVSVPAAGQHDLVLTVQKLVADGAGRPVRGLREKPFSAVAGRDAVRIDARTWARRVPAAAAG